MKEGSVAEPEQRLSCFYLFNTLFRFSTFPLYVIAFFLPYSLTFLFVSLAHLRLLA